jgi:hypothetical protein
MHFMGHPQLKVTDAGDRRGRSTAGHVSIPLTQVDACVVGARTRDPQFVAGVGVDDDRVHRVLLSASRSAAKPVPDGCLHMRMMTESL